MSRISYTDEILDNLEASLSPERLLTYLDATDGNREGAIRFHIWNTAVGSTFYGPLQILEVTRRNAMNRRLSKRYGQTWYNNDRAGLSQKTQRLISRTRKKLGNVGHGDVPHRIVAALSFGFRSRY